MAKYIYEHINWTDFEWQDKAINALFGEVRLMQGKLIGHMNALGFSAKEEATLSTLTLDVVKSSEIEGELLNYDQVRSSIARRLGINTAGLVPSSRHIEGVVEMMLDATQRHALPLTEKRLCGWHAALFPTGYSGPYQIEVGRYRTGEMQVVSGAMGKEKVHYEAIKPEMVKTEMDKFLDWFNSENLLDPVLKAAIAHFWFIIIHPFDDGNGRIGRAITDMLLARAEGSGERFYSMSSQILVRKAEFWKLHQPTAINERQRLIINKLFDGFEGKLQTSKWAKIAKTSTDTALRDIKDLIQKGILQQTSEGGRNANYELVNFNHESQ